MLKPKGEPLRSRAARESAERALVRIVHQYGERPGVVVIGGLVPELLCAGSAFHHAGTTDVDVRVDLEIAFGVVNTARLERALCNAEFVPEDSQIWRWVGTALIVLQANFAALDAQGTHAYVQQMWRDHPDLDPATLAADAVLAVEDFHRCLRRSTG